MQTNKITTILEGENFSEELEKYLLSEINDECTNPFISKKEEVSGKVLFNTIIYCTLLLANIIYLLHNR